ncbi:MAG: helix-turn-helix domain-containing protein [Ruminococcus sp.]|nr:helix-turn-helix domain-containing protein [Ruminococcus sp.]
MTYTKFGEFMRVLRVQHHEVMGDVAKLLGVSTPFLSAVENGRKNVPDEWFDIIAEHYALSDNEIADMKMAAENSRNQVKITLSKSENYQREVALQFARSFDGIDEDTAEKIMALLKRSGNN